jgi:uncharacterized repeat protein (TIGR03806 family)
VCSAGFIILVFAACAAVGCGAAGPGGGATGGGGTGGASAPGACTPPADVYAPIDRLTRTGCMDPLDPTKPVSRAVPYEVNSPLWSDDATKSRAFVLPAGGKIHVKDCAAAPAECPQGAADDGKWVFPVGTVLIKSFLFDGKVVETRLFMHVDDATWAGYGYEWNEAQTEATIAPTDRDMGKTFDTGARTVTWNYPSRMDCMKCHDPAGGSTLGPETAQMNRVVGGTNQIDAFAAMGLFEQAPAQPYRAPLVTPYPGQAGAPLASATLDDEARSYLHANCAFCHRPEGQFPNFDLRAGTPLAAAGICGADTKKTATGITATQIMAPGDHASSALWQRVQEVDPDKGRMPQIGSYVVDTAGAQLIADWIDSVKVCP